MSMKTVCRVFDPLKQPPVLLGTPPEGFHRLAWFFHDLRPVERQPFAPSGHKDDLADLTLAFETSPYRACGRVVFLFLGKRPVDADDDVVARRELVVGVLPNLPPVTLKDAPFVRHRHLLQA